VAVGIDVVLVERFARALARTPLLADRLFTSDELFFSGTAVGVNPIREVDGRQIGDGGYPLSKKLQRMYDGAIHGRLKAYSKWLTKV